MQYTKKKNDPDIIHKYLFKYKKFDDHTMDILKKQQLYLSSPTGFNDPFDSKYNIDLFCDHVEKKNIKVYALREFQKMLERATSPERCGILCMSKNYQNILMWSHYADNHRGICFGFEKYNLDTPLLDNEKYKNAKINFFDVKYKCHPFYNLIYKYNENPDTNFMEDVLNQEEFIEEAFTIKHQNWAYEEEVRLICADANEEMIFENSDNRLLNFEPEDLNFVYFGLNIDADDKKSCMSILNENTWKHVYIYQMKQHPTKFALECDLIREGI